VPDLFLPFCGGSSLPPQHERRVGPSVAVFFLSVCREWWHGLFSLMAADSRVFFVPVLSIANGDSIFFPRLVASQSGWTQTSFCFFFFLVSLWV